MEKAVIFDVDGTLINSFQVILEKHRKTAKKMGLRVPKLTEFAEKSGKQWETIIKELWPEVKPEKFICRYRELDKKEYPPREGGIMTVKELRKNGKAVGAVTGKPTETAKKALADAGYKKDWFEFIHGADSVKECKPDGEAFSNALEILGEEGIKKERTVYVGDGPLDLQAARAADIKFIGIQSKATPPGYFQENDAETIQRLPELPEKIKKII